MIWESLTDCDQALKDVYRYDCVFEQLTSFRLVGHVDSQFPVQSCFRKTLSRMFASWSKSNRCVVVDLVSFSSCYRIRTLESAPHASVQPNYGLGKGQISLGHNRRVHHGVRRAT